MSRMVSKSGVARLGGLLVLVQLTALPASAQVTFDSSAPPPAAEQALPLVPPPPPDAPAPLTQLVDKSVRDVQRGNLKAVVKDDVTALQRGPLLIHGNYCGIGNRPGSVPIDALDTACMHHDACTTDGKLPSCACDDRLRLESTAIANDPGETPDLRALAAATAASMSVLVCK